MNSSEGPITLNFHCEDGAWWVDSKSLPSLFAGGETLDEAKQLARQVVADEVGPDVWIVEWMPVPEPLRPVVTGGQRPKDASVQAWREPGDWSFDLAYASETEQLQS